MQTAAIAIPIFAGMILSIILSVLPLFLSGERARAAQERARATYG